MRLADLKGLGSKSEECLNEIGIFTPDDLKAMGAIRAFIKLKKEYSIKPSLNFLYAMAGALENKHWVDIARNEKGKLLVALDGYRELEAMLKSEGVDLEIL
jgi:DNA transformation protein